MARPGTGPRIIKRKAKPNYYIRFIDSDGKQKERSTGTAILAEAKEVLEDFLRAQRAYETGIALHPSKVTIAQTLLDYAHFKKDGKDAERLGYAMKHLLKFFEDRTLNHVNRETIKEYETQAPRSSGTIRRELVCLRAAINHAVSMNRVKPIAKIVLPKEGPPKTRWLDRNEMARLLQAAGKNYRTRFPLRLFIVIGFYTGARREAIMELEWSQIDFKTNTIDFEKPNREQNNKRRARIPIPRKLRPHLLRRYKSAEGKSSYVFHQKNAPYKQVKSVVKGFRMACNVAKLYDVTPHTLRHTRVSMLVQNGEKISDVKAYMDMSFPTLEKVYAHHNDQHIRDMADRM